jgi:hypothetical protein
MRRSWSPLVHRSQVQEVTVALIRNLLLIALVVILAAGCAMVQRAEQPEGPFEIAILAVTDTRGELEPCG